MPHADHVISPSDMIRVLALDVELERKENDLKSDMDLLDLKCLKQSKGFGLRAGTTYASNIGEPGRNPVHGSASFHNKCCFSVSPCVAHNKTFWFDNPYVQCSWDFDRQQVRPCQWWRT